MRLMKLDSHRLLTCCVFYKDLLQNVSELLAAEKGLNVVRSQEVIRLANSGLIFACLIFYGTVTALTLWVSPDLKKTFLQGIFWFLFFFRRNERPFSSLSRPSFRFTFFSSDWKSSLGEYHDCRYSIFWP